MGVCRFAKILTVLQNKEKCFHQVVILFVSYMLNWFPNTRFVSILNSQMMRNIESRKIHELNSSKISLECTCESGNFRVGRRNDITMNTFW